MKRTGARTSLIVDPPNGRIPPLTPEAQKIAAAEREFRLAMLQSTDTCKNKEPACSGGKYDPTPSPRRAELPPRYNTARMNRHDGPEDATLAERCLTGGLPEFGTNFGGSFRRIVQTPGGIAMFYDVGQGQGLAAQHRHERKPASAGQHPPVVWRLARPLGGQYARDRRDELQSEDRFSGLARESASGRALDAHRARHARIPGHDRRSDRVDAVHGPSSRSSPGRATRRTGFTPSRAASKEIMAFRACCMDGARKRPSLRKEKVPIRQPWTTSRSGFDR